MRTVAIDITRAQLSKNPEQLKQCFKNREHLINEFIDCVKGSGETFFSARILSQ